MIKLPSDSKWNVVDGPFYEGKKKVWHCICDCGIEALVNDHDLRSGRSKRCRSCGSSMAWSNTKKRPVNVKQDVLERVRGAVGNAIARCTDPKHKRYSDWGGRGIKVSFVSRDDFVEYILTLPGHDNFDLVLDRIDNDKNYEVGNLRFITRSESQENRRNQFDGEPYYMRHGFVHCFKRLHDKGLSFESIGRLYCVGGATIRNCVRELEGTR